VDNLVDSFWETVSKAYKISTNDKLVKI